MKKFLKVILWVFAVIAGLLIIAPGHTPGSACYIIGNEYFITDDNLVVKDGKFEHFNEMFNMDTPRQIESLKLLPASDSFEYILTGHNGIVKTKH